MTACSETTVPAAPARARAAAQSNGRAGALPRAAPAGRARPRTAAMADGADGARDSGKVDALRGQPLVDRRRRERPGHAHELARPRRAARRFAHDLRSPRCATRRRTGEDVSTFGSAAMTSRALGSRREPLRLVVCLAASGRSGSRSRRAAAPAACSRVDRLGGQRRRRKPVRGALVGGEHAAAAAEGDRRHPGPSGSVARSGRSGTARRPGAPPASAPESARFPEHAAKTRVPRPRTRRYARRPRGRSPREPALQHDRPACRPPRRFDRGEEAAPSRTPSR